jgi:4-hydroxy-tetrahydrodipicolinate reductase
MDAVILGDGPLGRAIAAALSERGDRVRVLGRPAAGGHDRADLARADVVFEASRGASVGANVADGLVAGVRRFVIATTAWEADRVRIGQLLGDHAAAAVAAANLSLGMALFGRIVDEAVARLGGLPGWDPYLVEWHRRGKTDRPSGTARGLASRIIAAHPRLTRMADPAARRAEPDALEVFGVRAGANPGSHLVGFDGPGESIELRHAARDRSAYAAGALAAADWLLAEPRAAGIHDFDPVVDALFAASAVPAGAHPGVLASA